MIDVRLSVAFTVRDLNMERPKIRIKKLFLINHGSGNRNEM